jgi:hypothetical protein
MKRMETHQQRNLFGLRAVGATYYDDEKLEISEFYKESNGLLIYITSSYKQDGDCRDRNNNCKEKQLYKLMRNSFNKACR